MRFATRVAAMYLDANATTPLAEEVLAAMLPWLREGFHNPSSTHAGGKKARAAIEEARAQVAELIGAREDEIVFTQPTNRVRPELDGDEAIALQMEIRMVSILFGNNGHILEEGEPLEEILDLPVLADSRVVVSQKPAGEIAQLAIGKIERAGINATFARLALLLA